MNFVVTVNVPDVQRALQRFAAETGQNLKMLFEDQMRLWAVSLIQWFPPSARLRPKGKRHQTSSGKTMSAMGEANDAVAQDILKVFTPVTELGKSWWEEANLNLMVHAYEGAKGRGVYGVEKENFFRSAGIEELEAIHNPLRNAAGRVRSQFHMPKKVGGYTVSTKRHVRAAHLRRYIQYKRSHVGTLKAGWLPMMEKWSKGVTVAPGFVTRNRARAAGSAGGQMGLNGTGFLFGENAVPYAGRFARIVNLTTNLRQGEIRRRLTNLVASACAKFNAGQSGGVPAKAA